MNKPLEYPHAKPKTARVDLYKRDPLCPFPSLEREKFAIARAKGQTIKQAAEAAGVSSQSGHIFDRHPAMRARVSELREKAETFVGVSTSWILSQLMINAKESRDLEQFKASNDALMLIYKIMGENRDLANEMARALPPDTSPGQLREALSKRFSQRAALPRPAYTPPPAPSESGEEDAEASGDE